jgi:hypothetical protein
METRRARRPFVVRSILEPFAWTMLRLIVSRHPLQVHVVPAQTDDLTAPETRLRGDPSSEAQDVLRS